MNSLADISLRLSHSPSQTVELVLQRSLVLPSPGIVMDAGFSCTILRSDHSKAGLSIALQGASSPVLTIANTSNVAVLNISFSIGVSEGSSFCSGTALPESNGNFVCPAIYVWRSYGIQIAQVRGCLGAWVLGCVGAWVRG